MPLKQIPLVLAEIDFLKNGNQKLQNLITNQLITNH